MAAACKSGLAVRDAEWFAEALVQSHLWGVDSHGVIRLATYIGRFKDGSFNPRPAIQPVFQLPALEVLDGDNGSGYIVARAAMDRAIEPARVSGISMVSVIHSNHFGTAGLYAMQAARSGMVGIVMSNVVPLMVIPGGSAKVLGNNPLAVAVPRDEDFPFLLDTSLSVVANGRIKIAEKEGEKIPFGWAVDKDGQPTDDPRQAASLLPIAGYKGVGLAYAIELLTGVISGGSFLTQLLRTNSKTSSDIAHTMIAINTQLLLGNEALAERMAQFSDIIKTSPRLDPNQETLLPGERKERVQHERLENGIPLPSQLYKELVKLGETLEPSVALNPL